MPPEERKRNKFLRLMQKSVREMVQNAFPFAHESKEENEVYLKMVDQESDKLVMKLMVAFEKAAEANKDFIERYHIPEEDRNVVEVSDSQLEGLARSYAADIIGVRWRGYFDGFVKEASALREAVFENAIRDIRKKRGIAENLGSIHLDVDTLSFSVLPAKQRTSHEGVGLPPGLQNILAALAVSRMGDEEDPPTGDKH